MKQSETLKLKLKDFASRLERKFDDRFEHFARDPKLLSLAAEGLNFLAGTKIRLSEFESEVASLKARARFASKAQSRNRSDKT